MQHQNCFEWEIPTTKIQNWKLDGNVLKIPEKD